ncbi:MAG: hypothetical protein WC297_02350 [Candidatus Paceibacterota bacterium]|jgi:hypothetical protein
MMTKKYKNLFLLVVIVLVFGITIIYAVSPHKASAALFSLGEVTKNALVGATNIFITVVAKPIIWVISKIFAGFLGFAININNEIFNPSNSYIYGAWQKARDIANLGFVLAIIVVAFGTILRMENYGFKKTLTKLIVAALLVNFSLMICAAIGDISNIATKAILGDTKIDEIGNTILNLSGINNIGGQEGALVGIIKETGNVVATGIAAPIFSLVCMVILLLTMIGIIIMLLIRYVVVGILVVLSPLAWLCSIFPATIDLWKKWWTHFLRWIFFAPVMMLFISFALTAGYKGGAQGFTNVGSAFASPWATIGNYFIFTGLLLGGLIIANMIGIKGADKILGITMAAGIGVGAGTALWMSRLAARGATRATGPIANQTARMASQGNNRFTRAIGQGITGAYRRATTFGGSSPISTPPTLMGSITERMRYHLTTKEGQKFIKNLMPKGKK